MRRVDPALTRRALAAIARAAKRAAACKDGLSPWEDEYLRSLQERLNTYGSAFADPDKGQLSSPLSLRQGLKLKQISQKGEEAAPPKPRKPRKPLSRKTPLRARKTECD